MTALLLGIWFLWANGTINRFYHCGSGRFSCFFAATIPNDKSVAFIIVPAFCFSLVACVFGFYVR